MYTHPEWIVESFLSLVVCVPVYANVRGKIPNYPNLVDIQRRFNVHMMSIDVVWTLCAYWESSVTYCYSFVIKSTENKVFGETNYFSFPFVYNNFCRNGSVIANLTLTFASFDSSQFLMLQDSVEIEKSLGKLQLKDHNPYILNIGPGGLVLCHQAMFPSNFLDRHFQDSD